MFGMQLINSTDGFIGGRIRSGRATRLAAVAAILAMTGVGAGDVDAGLSAIGTSSVAGEASHEQILEDRFGGDFAAGNAGSFSNGTVTVTRLDDDASAGSVFLASTAASARAIASFTTRQQSFGVIDSDGDYHSLFDVTGDGFDVLGSAADSPALDLEDVTGPLRVGRGGGGVVFSSDPGQNDDGRDHLVAYSVSGATAVGPGTLLLFWEDASARYSDFDYNDLVVEVSAAQPLLIPLPAAAWTGMAGLGGLAAAARFRNKARRRTS